MNLIGNSHIPALNSGRRFPMDFVSWLPSALTEGLVSAVSHYAHYRSFQGDITGITLSDSNRTCVAFMASVKLGEGQ